MESTKPSVKNKLKNQQPNPILIQALNSGIWEAVPWLQNILYSSLWHNVQ